MLLSISLSRETHINTDSTQKFFSIFVVFFVIIVARLIFVRLLCLSTEDQHLNLTRRQDPAHIGLCPAVEWSEKAVMACGINQQDHDLYQCEDVRHGDDCEFEQAPNKIECSLDVLPNTSKDRSGCFFSPLPLRLPSSKSSQLLLYSLEFLEHLRVQLAFVAAFGGFSEGGFLPPLFPSLERFVHPSLPVLREDQRLCQGENEARAEAVKAPGKFRDQPRQIAIARQARNGLQKSAG